MICRNSFGRFPAQKRADRPEQTEGSVKKKPLPVGKASVPDDVSPNPEPQVDQVSAAVFLQHPRGPFVRSGDIVDLQQMRP